jgi:hypothetical protein
MLPLLGFQTTNVTSKTLRSPLQLYVPATLPQIQTKATALAKSLNLLQPPISTTALEKMLYTILSSLGYDVVNMTLAEKKRLMGIEDTTEITA